MKKYLIVFRLEVKRKLEYRFNFFLEQLRALVVFILLYSVWTNLTTNNRLFAGYSKIELVTYVVGVTLLYPLMFSQQTRQVAIEINTGSFSQLIIKPLNYFWYNFARECADRMLSFFFSLFSLVALFALFHFDVFLQGNPKVLAVFSLATLLALFLSCLISFVVNLIAFWSREASGPRFVLEWIMYFTSGQFFPLNILSPILYGVVIVLPFAYILFVPIQMYLGRLTSIQMVGAIFVQLLWIGILSLITHFVWKKGVARYSGEGI